ncbi:hypothetical protein X474_20575 [Dethiosulfatarculus sandiegensis]|uniref:Uncharacterized protein n=1 Tax=Dethiosulfatarculus sandiegensis TaxID=1429043 RepID=A0A0D2J258_9BACT|nr:hypothetical protein X474_20575 [Dethiosulfatarculus sandiegensis]
MSSPGFRVFKTVETTMKSKAAFYGQLKKLSASRDAGLNRSPGYFKKGLLTLMRWGAINYTAF